MAQAKTGKPARKIDESTRLTVADIRRALEGSGYPLEVRLFDELVELGARPTLGRLVPTGGDSLQEIDLLARFGRFASAFERDGVVTPRSLRMERRLVIGVKKLHSPRRFVGIVGEQPNDLTRRNIRSQVLAGLPSRGVDDALRRTNAEDLILGHGFGKQFDVGLAVPVCVHWAIVRWRKKDNKTVEPFADSGQDATGDRYYKDLETTCLAAFALSVEETRAAFEPHRRTSLSTVSYQPVLVVDTPNLFAYHPRTKKLTRADWLTLHRSFEVPALGRAVAWAIDVLTPKALGRYVAETKSALDVGFASAGFPAADQDTTGIDAVAKAQVKRVTDKENEEAAVMQREQIANMMAAMRR